MLERFTETLRTASEPGWSHAVQHQFVQQLIIGAVPDAVMARYLIQDHRFLDSFLVLLGAALASADTFAARLRFGRFIGMVSAEENTYFLRAFEALGVTEARRAADPDTQATWGSRRSCTKRQTRAVMRLRFRSSLWPNGSISIGPPEHRSRCRTTSYTPSGSRCTTIPIFGGSLVFCVRNWIALARLRRVCVATSVIALSASNFLSLKPPIRLEFLLRISALFRQNKRTWKIHGCNRLSCQGADGRLRGTDGSNPVPSSGESCKLPNQGGPPSAGPLFPTPRPRTTIRS